MPKLAGKTVDAAQDLLQEAHLAYGRSFKKYDDAAPKGRVIGSDPKAGTKEPPGFQVDLIVSKGPRPSTSATGRARAPTAPSASSGRRDCRSTRASRSTPTPWLPASSSRRTPSARSCTAARPSSLTVSRGTRADPDPRATCAAWASTPPDGRSGEPRLPRARSQKTDFYVGLGYVVGSDPDPGSMAPHGSRSSSRSSDRSPRPAASPPPPDSVPRCPSPAVRRCSRRRPCWP